MSQKRKSPSPILLNLTDMGNPFKQKTFDVVNFFEDSPIVGAHIDYEYALKFIYSYRGSVATFNAYRRELERLLQWSWRIAEQSVLLLKREDIEDYVQFCINPPLAWIGTASHLRFIKKDGVLLPNKQWRPYVATLSKEQRRQGKEPQKKRYTLSQAAIRSLFAILSSFYDYVAQEGVLDSNPVALIRQKSRFLVKEQQLPTVRRITNLQWDYVIETVEIMSDEFPEKHERTLFILNCLLGMYLRISELVADERSIPQMNHFKHDHDNHWWFHVIGKGNKSRKIAVSMAMLKALKRYRRSMALTPLPAQDDASPLIPKLRGNGPVRSSRQESRG